MREIVIIVPSGAQTRGMNAAHMHFDYAGWVGLSVIKDALERAGYSVGLASPEDVYGKIGLVSVTSAIAWRNILKWWRPEWSSDTTIICGGAGLLNVRPFLPLPGIVFVLGRGEKLILDLIAAEQKGGRIESPSVIYPDTFNVESRYEIRQEKELYPYPVTLTGAARQPWVEKAQGCQYRCSFCNYTWVRAGAGEYGVQFASVGQGERPIIAGASQMQEDNLRHLIERLKRGEKMDTLLNSAIDGQSQRIRDAVHKPLRRDEIREFAKITRDVKHGFSSLMTVVGFPTETAEDRAEAIDDLWAGVQDRADGYVVLEVSTNVFRPMPCTPCALWPASLLNYPDVLAQEWAGASKDHPFYVRNGDKGHIRRTWTCGSAASLLWDLICLRGSESDHDALMRVATNHKYWASSSAVQEATLRKYFDIDRLAGEYTPEDYPVRYLHGHTDNGVVWRIGASGLAKLRAH